MTCPSCSHENRPGAKFCEECATPLKRVCSSCGAELRPTAKFCDECATPVAARAASGARSEPKASEVHRAAATRSTAPAGTRKIVTIVFADLVGSTALHERLDPESARRFMESYYDAMRGAVESHGGTVTQLLGDGVKAVFGIPRVAEDDAIRAVRAAVAMQEAFRALAEQQRGAVGKTGLRVAVNTGEVVANDETEIIGDPVNVAARLQEQGADGDVVVGDSTARLVDALVTLAPLGSFALKGRAEAVAAFRVESLERPAGAATSAFVGRDDEIARITAVYTTAVEKPATALAVLVGSPGLGKSRLIDEFARRLDGGATVVEAHCDEASVATFAPLADALRELLGIEVGASAESMRETIAAAAAGTEAERARIAGGIAALLAGAPASPEETFFVVRRLFAALAAARPVVLVIDDLQWAEPLLLDLVEHLVQWGSGVPLLVLIGARPELREMRSSLVTPGGFVSDVVTLAGLDAGAAMKLAANVIGAADLPAAVAAKVLAASEGNPLFVGELVRMLVHEGALEKEGDRWTTGTALAALEMPPTIHALLAARIERLRSDERLVLERAAVVGRHFSRSAVEELLPRDVTDLDARLESLRRSELIERDTGWFLGEPVLRFHHVLIRDAAYRQLLKGTRAELHTRFADWVLARAGDSVEHDEMIGWHLEQAHQHLRELGPLDAAGRAIGERAAKHLAAAGRRALARDDVPLAASLLGRAIARLDPDDPARADLALDWCEALLAAGDVGPAEGAIAELDRFVGDSERLRAWHTCFAGQHTVLTAPEGLQATADAVAAAAESLAAQDDAAGEAKAHFVYALALARLGKIGACEAALDRALAAARRVAGDRRRANTVLAIAPLAALWGPSPVTRASGRCLDVVRVLRITQGAPAVEAVALSCQGVLEALRGRTDAARRMIASARKMVEELGITNRLLEADVFGGLVELLEGDALAAERSLRGAYTGMRELGLGIDAARAAALLARALLSQDRVAEAEALSHESEALAGDDLKAAIAWRGVRAEALARRGEHASAVEFASKAVEIAAATDALLDHADARLALAAALRAAGRGREADAEERRASELWEAKGATLLAERAQRVGGGAEPVTAPGESPVAAAASRQHVRPNAATAMHERMLAAFASRDFDVNREVMRDDWQEVDHPTGSTYGPDAAIASLQRLFRSRDPHYETESLATLADSLLLIRRRTGAGGAANARYDVGAYENEALQLIEVDERGLFCRSEVFAADRLGDAVVRLYERYAEVLPAGPEQTRAAAAAHSRAVFLSSHADPGRLAPVLAPAFEGIDHRHLGNWSLRGADAYIEHLRALQQVADDVEFHRDDILALAPDAELYSVMHTGTGRASGGAYERPFLALVVTDADGRIARAEWFDIDREAEALARFDALTVEVALPRGGRRRVRPNGATAAIARFDAACAARGLETALAQSRADFAEIDHPTGSSYGLDGVRDGLRRLLRAQDPHMAHEALVTLGDSLLLARRSTGARATAGGRFDVGAWAREELVVTQVDANELLVANEIFAGDRLGDALVRLYERYAESMPEGPERDRGAATARSIAALLGAADLDAWCSVLASDVAFEDHRILGFGPSRGRDEARALLQTLFDSSESVTSRIDDVLRAAPGALLLHWTERGVAAVGGDFERVLLTLWILDGDGLFARVEYFDADREAEALARFDEIAGGAAQLPVHRRVRPNAATRSGERFAEILAARDGEALAQHFADSLRIVHHPSGATYGRREMLVTWRSALKARRLEYQRQTLASLGDALGLERHVTTVEGLTESHLSEFGLTEIDELALVEVDESGRFLDVELFAVHQLGDAIVRLYQRHAELLPEGPARERAATNARVVSVQFGPPDVDAWCALFGPATELVDHRILGIGSVRGGDALRAYYRAMFELESFTIRVDDILELQPDALLVHTTTIGTARTGGGAYERPLWLIHTVRDGFVARVEYFDPGCEADALACFDARVGSDAAEPEAPFANAASRLVERGMHQLWATRDWDGILAMISPAMRMDDRRRIMRLEIGYDEFVVQFRMLFDQPASRWQEQLLATRGERLSLTRTRFEAEVADGGGPLAVEDHFSLAEIDAEGRITAFVTFDLDDEDAAYAELDARFEADPDALHARVAVGLTRAIVRRDWDAVVALCSPRFVQHDHRSLAMLGTTRGPAAWVQNFRTLVELAPDSTYRVHHTRSAARGFVVVGTWQGSREGGRYEIPNVVVAEVDERGAIARTDIYEPDQQDAVRARVDELNATGPPTARFANAASRVSEQLNACWRARDWARLAQLLPAEFRFRDRRRMAQLDLDRAQYLESTRVHGEMKSTRLEMVLLATRGERLALGRHRLVLAGDDVGPSEIVNLTVIETNERGDPVALVRYDEEDLDTAYAELDARWDAGEPAAHPQASGCAAAFRRGFAARDWAALVALTAPDQVAVNHRTVGWGTMSGQGAWVRALEELVGLAEDTKLQIDHLRTCARGFLWTAMWQGTRDGGAYETPWIMVIELDAQGRETRLDVWDIEQLDVARARFDEIAAIAPGDPRAAIAKPNLATASAEPLNSAFGERDLDAALQALDAVHPHYAPDFVWEDRRPIVGISGDLELMLASARERLVSGARHEHRTIVGAAGDRISVARALWAGGPPEGRFEVEFLALNEVNEAGLATATILFDPDDMRGAQREAWARWAAIDPVAAPAVELLNELTDAWNARDRARLRARFADDLVVEDHRRAGLGRVEGADAYVEANAVLWELAPQQQIEFGWSWPALDRHGAVVTLRREGTLPDGDAFENDYVWLCLPRDGRVAHLELFESDALDAALARFEQLRADPVRIPPNAATQALGPVARLMANRDLEGLRATAADDFCFDDRSRRAQLRGGVEEWLRALQFLRTEIRGQMDARLVATAGDRLALHHVFWNESPGDSRFLIENYRLTEIDAAGNLRAIVIFDPDDCAAAHAELFERYVASGADGMPRGAIEYVRGLNGHDLVRARTGLCDDFVIDDHRRTGIGRLEGADAYIASIAVAYELAPDLRIDVLHGVATAAHGRVLLVRASGTNTEGGAFESIYLALVRYRDEKVAAYEFFEPEHLDAALARFEALRPS